MCANMPRCSPELVLPGDFPHNGMQHHRQHNSQLPENAMSLEEGLAKDRELKDKETGEMRVQDPEWLSPWYLAGSSYVEFEAKLSKKANPDESGA